MLSFTLLNTNHEAGQIWLVFSSFFDRKHRFQQLLYAMHASAC